MTATLSGRHIGWMSMLGAILQFAVTPCRTAEGAAGVPEWLGNAIGISEEPPSPYTPMRLEGTNTILCWNRRYELGAMGLPSRIVSGGRELLSAPATFRLLAMTDGRTRGLYWTNAVLEVVERSAVRVKLRGRAVSTFGTCEWLCTAEFDGMIRYDFTVVPEKDIPVSVLEARFPLNPRYARLYRMMNKPGPAGARHNRTGSMAEVRRHRQDFWATEQPYWWIGDEDGGLAGFCESLEAWDRTDRGDAFFVANEPDAVAVVWRPIDGVSKTVLTSPWKWTFAIQATPVKPVPKRGRHRIWSQGFGNVKVMFWTNPGLANYFGFPSVADADAFHELTSRYQEKGILAVPYSCLTMVSEKVPEWERFKDQWNDGGRRIDFTDNQVRSFGARFVGVAPVPSWIDFIVWSNDRFVRDTAVDGLYHDWTGAYTLSRPEVGFGYVRDGTTRHMYPFFATRELYKRDYTMLKQRGAEQGRDMFSLIHCSGQVLAPLFAFCDGYVVGEALQKKFRPGRHYLDLVNLDELRAEFMGHNYGALPFFLPAQPDVGKETTQELLGLALLHDFSIWAAWCDVEAVNALYRLLDSFGYGDAEFLPYWHNDAVIGRQDNEIKASAYRRHGDGALVCVMNTGKKARRAVLAVNWDALKSPGALTVTDAFSGAPVKVNERLLILDNLPPYGFRLVRVK